MCEWTWTLNQIYPTGMTANGFWVLLRTFMKHVKKAESNLSQILYAYRL